MIFLRYVLIQLLAYGIDMGLFLVLLHSGFASTIGCNILAKLCAGVFAFMSHRHFTFHLNEKASIGQQAIRYLSLLALNIPIASAVLAFLLVWIANPVVAKFMADVCCVVLSYILSKRFIFTGQVIPVKEKSSTGGDE